MTKDDKMLKKNASYLCEKCCYSTGNKTDYNRHILTPKHKRVTTEFVHVNVTNENKNVCACGNVYKYRQGLFKHKKECEKMKKLISNQNMDFDKNIIIELLKQNGDLQKQLLELYSKPNNIINNNTVTNTNSHNKQFNLQFFLNDTCKNAMNMSDFMDSLEIKSSELEDMGKLGYVKGISNIFIRALKELDETERPLHCTDKKREIIYIKDNNVWEKETNDKLKVKKIVTYIANKNFRNIPKWKKDNPQSDDIMSKKHMEYMMMLSQVMSGITPDDEEGINKIVRCVANEVCIDKTCGV